jgi:TetR/AcrR family transcriptional repressor of lmrAB and yxaGH operons
MGYAKSLHTRSQLLKKTAKLLCAQGYAATTLSDLITESGVPKGSLYHHFPGGKEQVAAESVRLSGERIVDALTALADRHGDPVSALRGFCDGYIVRLQRSDFREGCPLATVALESAANIDQVHGACREAFAGITELLASRFVGRGVEPAAADEAAIYAVAAIEGALLLAKARRDVRPVEIVRDRLVGELSALIDRHHGQ